MKISLEVNTRCINCDLCRLVCPEESVIIHDNQYVIDSWSCTLCGVCIELCPTDAIKLTEEE